jgi:uncharacterized protein with ParB-like and HNH nuclease domain
MSYEKTSIKKMIDDIDHNKVYLPALQRKFVWGRHKIELLFDSLMRNYPFGTFLFWKLHREKAESYVFYKFLTHYDERQPFNERKTGVFTHEEILGILDGQQRLSSMYIGLMGTHTERLKYTWANNPNNYEKTSLYLNLLSLPYYLDADDEIRQNEEKNFEFRFLSEAKVQGSPTRKVEIDGENGKSSRLEPMFWMKVGQVLGWREYPEFDQIIERFINECTDDFQREALRQQKRLIRRALETLHRQINREALINYFEITTDDLEDILKIFVRVNSLGTPLSKPDLLFSTIVATWEKGRDEIESLLKKINAYGFSFGHEYLMRCCLILSDGPAVYKVNSFKAENVENIKTEWPRISAAVEKTVVLLKEFGFDGSTLQSHNATIPLAYYLYKGGDANPESKTAMRKYLIHTLIKGVFGSSQDQVLINFRNSLREEVKNANGAKSYVGRYKNFSFDAIVKTPLPQQKSLMITADDIERFLMHKKGAASFAVLALLYPQLRFSEVTFHQDHIHPAAHFTEARFRAMGIPDEQWQEWLEYRDSVPNLQLMEGKKNESKNATPFKDWFIQLDAKSQEIFVRDNYLPDEVDFGFENFKRFFEARKEI